MQNTAITTKVGLLQNLRSLMWFQNVDLDTFFPRAYSLNDINDMQAFVDDFKAVHAEGLLKKLLVIAKSVKNGSDCTYPKNVNAAVLESVVSICSKRQEISSDDQLDNAHPFPQDIEALVTDLEWEVLSHCTLFENTGILSALQPPVAEMAVEMETNAKERKRMRRQAKRRHESLQKERTRVVEKCSTLVELTQERADAILALNNGKRIRRDDS